MKATKKIVGATAALVAAVALSAGSTFAWFSTRSSVQATGMQVAVSSSDSYLVISTTSGTYTTNDVSFTSSGQKSLAPSTHISGTDTWNLEGGFPSGLKYVTNPDKIDPSTGLETDTLNYANATTSHYFDYVVYLASQNGAISTAQDLTVTLNSIITSADILKAVSIDFYVGDTVSSTTYGGTLNLAKVASDNSDFDANTVDSKVISGDNGCEIPGIDGGLKVTMRIYVDGALLKSESEAYVNSQDVSTSGVTFGVTFSIKNHL